MGTHESYMAWLNAKDTHTPKIGTWQPADNEDAPEHYQDGDQFLVAVPVMWKSGMRQHASHDKNAKWFYEYSVVTVQCDEHFFGLTCNGEAWGWEWSDVEWWMNLTD